jgi:hypothetical protein
MKNATNEEVKKFIKVYKRWNGLNG